MSQTDTKPIQSRNLYAIDYLKNHEVTCEEFAKAWEDLADDLRQVSQPTTTRNPLTLVTGIHSAGGHLEEEEESGGLHINVK